MIPENEHASRYLYESTIEELIEKYKKQGCTVDRNVKVGNQVVDLLVTEPAGHQIYIEVKVRHSSSPEKSRMGDIKKYVQSLQNNASFRLVVVSPPHERTVEVQGIEEKLFKGIIGRNTRLNDLLEDGWIVNKVSRVENDKI